MGIKIVTQPIAEPLTLEECYAHLRIVPDEESSDLTHPDDSLILAQIGAARQFAEDFTGLSIAVKTYELALDAFPEDEIKLPHPPLVEIESVRYVDPDEVVQTVPSVQYVIDTYQTAQGAGWLFPAKGVEWPATDDVVNAVKIRYRAGYAVDGDGSDVEPLPYTVKAALLLIVGHLYEHREEATEKALAEIPLGAKALLRPLRVRFGMA